MLLGELNSIRFSLMFSVCHRMQKITTFNFFTTFLRCMLSTVQDEKSVFGEISLLIDGVSTVASRGAIRRAWYRSGSNDVRSIMYGKAGIPMPPLKKRGCGRRPKIAVRCY